MMSRKGRRWTAGVIGGGLLLLLTACGPEVSDVACEQQKDGDAKYTFTLKNTEDDKDITFQWIVKDDPDDDRFNRKGDEISLGASKTTTKSVTVKKGDDGKRVQVFWPGPKGDDTMKYNKVIEASCP